MKKGLKHLNKVCHDERKGQPSAVRLQKVMRLKPETIFEDVRHVPGVIKFWGPPVPIIPVNWGPSRENGDPCYFAVQAVCDGWILTSRHSRGKAGLLKKLTYGL